MGAGPAVPHTQQVSDETPSEADTPTKTHGEKKEVGSSGTRGAAETGSRFGIIQNTWFYPYRFAILTTWDQSPCGWSKGNRWSFSAPFRKGAGGI